MSIFNEAFEVVLGHEGGYQNLHNDRGNWTTGIVGKGVNKGTKYGITAMTYPNLDIKNLTLDDARRIYKQDFWDRINGDKLEPALALVAFDTAINSGVGKALEFLNKTADVDTFLNLRRTYLKNLKLYNTVISGNRQGKTYGRVWDERLNLLARQAAQWKKLHPVNTVSGAQDGQEGASNNSDGYKVLLDTGQGFIELTDVFENDKIKVNPMDGKVYIKLK